MIWNCDDRTAPSLAACGAEYPCTVVSLARIDALACGPLPEEASYVAGAVPARRREFAAARTLARDSMQALGFAFQPIPRHANRAPVWPQGLVGSLSHCRHLAAAAVSASLAAIGIDIECRDRVEPKLFGLVFTEAERRILVDEAAASAAFSAKEAVFKAIHPLTGKRPEFKDVEIALDIPTQRFVAKYSGPETANTVIDDLVGFVALTSDHVLTIAVRDVPMGCAGNVWPR